MSEDLRDILYCGVRLNGDELNEQFLTMDQVNALSTNGAKILENDLDRCGSLFSLKRTPKGQSRPGQVIGGVYMMPCTLDPETNRIIKAKVAAREFKYRLKDWDLCILLNSLDATARARHGMIRAEKKLENFPVLRSEIASLREHYHKLPYRDRLAFELLILNELRHKV